MSKYSINLRKTGRINNHYSKIDWLKKQRQPAVIVAINHDGLFGYNCRVVADQLNRKLVIFGYTVCVALSALVPGLSVMAVETVPIVHQADVVWAFDAALPGNNLPPLGSSLFDHLFVTDRAGTKTYDVPFPFEKLRQRIRLHTQGDGNSEVGFKETLIPFSRALPRLVAAPEFFKFPRLVLAVDGDFLSSRRLGPLLKDRLYIGYQEKAASLEVISYNEIAGRFEFQIVRDYAAGRTPRVIYAERRLCVSCHQNGGPIFPEPPWSETNGNPEIGRRILQETQNFHGIPSYSGLQTIDQPRAISDAVERANLFSAYQQVWRKGCAGGLPELREIACRSAMLTAALQYKLSGSRHFDTASNRYWTDLVVPLRQAWQLYWPNGLSIPDPRVPDRDPMVTGAKVSAELDPLRLRPSLQLWLVDEPGVIEAVITGLSQFISNADARRLDAHLFSAASDSGLIRTSHKSPCALSRKRLEGLPQRIMFRCEQQGADHIFGSGYLFINEDNGIIGETRSFKFGGGTDFEEFSLAANSISVKEGRFSVLLTPLVKRTGLHPRLPDGAAVESIALSWEAIIEEDFGPSDEFPNYRDNGRLVVTLVHDFAPVHDAIAELGRDAQAGEQDLFSDQPFRRSVAIGSLLQRMGLSDAVLCCTVEESPPAIEVERPLPRLTGEAGESDPAAAVRQAFGTYCAACHTTSEPFPPNFLRGESAPIGNAIAQCGERIAYRLAMWDRPEEQRNKSPMPPQSFLLSAGLSAQEWRSSASFAELRSHMSGLLTITGSSAKQVEFIGGQDYEALRSCLANVD